MPAPKKTSSQKSSKKPSSVSSPIVGIIMGSDSDLKTMAPAAEALDKFHLPYEMKVVSAHRTPDDVAAYGKSACKRGIRVIIAGAGGAAHLPGMVAAFSELPVIGVPVPNGPLQGEDALLSIVQMPRGIPVATVAIGNSWNAGILAAQILAAGGSTPDEKLLDKLRDYKMEMAAAVRSKKI